MKIQAHIILLLGCASLAMGQAPSPSPSVPPLPPGPLLKRAPDFSSWTVTVQGSATGPMEASTGGESPSKEKQPPATVSTVTKTGSTILEQNVDATGERRSVWHYSGLRIVPGVGGATPMICPDYGGGDIFSINFASSDFAGLDWLSPAAYAGIEKYQGNDCIVFKGAVSPHHVRDQIAEREYIEQMRGFGQPVGDALRVPAVAYISLETRLPLMVAFGNEKRFYQYGPAPTAPLELPPEVAGQVKEYLVRIQRLSAPPSRSF